MPDTKPVMVILAGGRGERFWPLSRRQRPKQLLQIFGGKSLLQQTLELAESFTELARIFIVVNRDCEALARRQAAAIPEKNVLVEPESRNTAPAVALAAFHIAAELGTENPVTVFLPSDLTILRPEQFRSALNSAITRGEGCDCLTLLGIKPERPEPGYGYIRYEPEPTAGQPPLCYQVKAFIEKPDRAAARKYLRSGEYLWNGGVFAGKIGVFLAGLKDAQPGIYHALAQVKMNLNPEMAAQSLESIYAALPALSFDRGVLEKSTVLQVIAADYEWKDMGNWEALTGEITPDDDGNVSCGDFTGIDSQNCLAFSPKKAVVALGVKNLLIAETGDVLFIGARERLTELKTVIAKLKLAGKTDLL